MTNPTNATNAYTVPRYPFPRRAPAPRARPTNAMQERAYAKRGEQYLLINAAGLGQIPLHKGGWHAFNMGGFKD